MSIIENIVGETFEKLTVIEFIEYRKTPSNRNVPIVNCLCECGNYKKVSLWDLRSGKTKTCGNKNAHPLYKDRSLPAFKNIYKHAYKGRAIKKGLAFTITEKQFKNLTQKNCHYCGIEPNGVAHRGTIKTDGEFIKGEYLSEYVYNGLDRIDSNKGYTADNVVTCCGVCNHAKHTMEYDVFIEWLDRIVAFRK